MYAVLKIMSWSETFLASSETMHFERVTLGL
jgi:hypothetical protein